MGKDTNNQDGKRPAEVTVHLKDGNGATVQTLTLNEVGSWKGTFTNVPVNDTSGNPINYTVEEVVIGEGYTTNVTGM